MDEYKECVNELEDYLICRCSLMSPEEIKLEMLAIIDDLKQKLTSDNSDSVKSCGNCGREKYCDYKSGECVGLDLVPKKWIPA